MYAIRSYYVFAHEAIHEDVPVFYGAVSLYLKQMIPAFRKMPDKIMRVFDSAPMLKLAAEMSVITSYSIHYTKLYDPEIPNPM